MLDPPTIVELVGLSYIGLIFSYMCDKPWTFFYHTLCRWQGLQPNRELDKQPSQNIMAPPAIPTFKNNGNIGAKQLVNMGNEHSPTALSGSQSKVDTSSTQEDSNPPWMSRRQVVVVQGGIQLHCLYKRAIQATCQAIEQHNSNYEYCSQSSQPLWNVRCLVVVVVEIPQ